MKVCHQLVGIVIVAMLIAGGGSAADRGGIPEKMIESLQATDWDAATTTMSHIIANESVSKIALNRARYLAHDKFINHKITTGDITNQKSSGRCWMFAGLNVLRPQAMNNLGVKKLEFSENYLLFWDKLEKSNLFLQLMIDLADRPLDDREIEIVIDGPLGDGGWWSYFVGLVDKYGLVPAEVMPETYNSSATGIMNKFLNLKLKEMGVALRALARQGTAADQLTSRKQEMLTELYRLLVLHLGQPPTEFTWRYESSDTAVTGTVEKTFTPQSFYEAAVSENLDDYVALFNYPGKDFYKNYSIRLSRNMYDLPNFTIVNVPADTMRFYAAQSVLDSTPVWFACDVGQENYRTDGIMALDIFDYEAIYGTTFDLPKADLIHMGLIGPTHAMAFMGADTADGEVRKWLVENSWGGEKGDGGLWYMYNDWFDRYMFGVIVHKRYLSDGLKKIAGEDPVVLPPWDPMYMLNRLN